MKNWHTVGIRTSAQDAIYGCDPFGQGFPIVDVSEVEIHMSSPTLVYVEFHNSDYDAVCEWLVAQGWASRHAGGMKGVDLRVVENLGQKYSCAWFHDETKAMLFKLSWGRAGD